MKAPTTKTSGLPAAPGSPSRIWVDGGITHPCGHEASFDESCIQQDRFQCPECGMRWQVQQARPIQHPTGWVEPGKRAVQIEAQREFPALFNVAALAKCPRPPLARVLTQIAAGNRHRANDELTHH